jgi:cytochrome c-type biogenesis protein CcmE
VGTGVRVAGRVQPGTIDYDLRTLHLRFHIGEFEKGRSPDTVPVAFTGIKPDMFAEGRDVIVEGKYAEGVLRADKVLTSCPSKYEAKAEAGAPATGAAAAPPA